MNFWSLVFIIAVCMVALDKILTYTNLTLVENNNLTRDPLAIEKNPVARWFFQVFGLLGGTVIYFVLSVLTFMLAVWVLTPATAIWAPANARAVALYLIMIVYSFVITNNLYFMLKFAGILKS